MIAVLKVSMPIHTFKQVVQAFMSPDIPKRPDSMKELGSVAYTDESGDHAVFMFDLPDSEVSNFLTLQSMRSAFIGARAPGFSASVHVGLRVPDSIKALMPMHP
jgi:hypothetical protein